MSFIALAFIAGFTFGAISLAFFERFSPWRTDEQAEAEERVRRDVEEWRKETRENGKGTQ